MNPYAMEMARMENLFGLYIGTFAANSSAWKSAWRDDYMETLQDIKVLLPVAQERNLSFHIGMAKVIEAHTLVSLVEFFGNVPYSETFQGDINPNPVADESSELYEVGFILIDEAIVALEEENSPVPTDLFYGGDREKWIAWANTLKLRLYSGEEYKVIVSVNPVTASATVSRQNAWHWSNVFAPQFGVGRVDEGGFVFSCVGLITLNLNFTVAAGSLGNFQIVAQKN